MGGAVSRDLVTVEEVKAGESYAERTLVHDKATTAALHFGEAKFGAGQPRHPDSGGHASSRYGTDDLLSIAEQMRYKIDIKDR